MSDSKDKSPLSRLPDDTREAMFELCQKHTFAEALGIINAPVAEGGLGVRVKKSALQAWHQKMRGERKTELLITRLRTGGELLDRAAGAIRQADPAKYDAAIDAAIREYTLDLLARGEASGQDIFFLGKTIADRVKNDLAREKLGIEQRRVAVQEQALAKDILAKSREIAAIANDSSLDDDAKVSAVRAHLWGADGKEAA